MTAVLIAAPGLMHGQSPVPVSDGPAHLPPRVAAAGVADGSPGRVVSINLCADQLAMLLAAPGQLLSVSWLARDPSLSSMWREAGAYPVNRGRAEDILTLRPDLVLAGEWTTPATVALLDRLGVDVVRLPVVSDFAGLRDALTRIGAALGRPDAARDAIERFDRALDAVTPSGAGPGRTAALYEPGGFTAANGTLAAEILRAAGLENAAEDAWRLPIERLVMADPDMILAPPRHAGHSRAEAMVRHPALRHGRDLRATGADWVCGTPAVLDAIRELVE